jgi:hypothetical protein
MMVAKYEACVFFPSILLVHHLFIKFTLMSDILPFTFFCKKVNLSRATVILTSLIAQEEEDPSIVARRANSTTGQH